MMSPLLTLIAIVSCADLVSGAFLAIPTSANCKNQAVLTCTSSGCQLAQRFIRNGTLIYNNGPISGTDPEKYNVSVLSDKQAQLTINNIQLSDDTTYACSCGFNNVSVHQPLQYECQATNSTATITAGKKLNITVDSLYPKPSSVSTYLTSPVSPIPGNYTCNSSFLLPFHYKCTWVSIASLPDGNHTYNLTVKTVTEAAPVTGSFRIVTPTSPTISNLVTISTNRQVVIGIQDNPMTIQCVSSGGIPAPTLAWYKGNTSTSQLTQNNTSTSEKLSDGTYTVTFTHNFTPRRADDLMPFLCQVFYPGATNGSSPNSSPATALMYLDLKPDNATVSQTGEAVSQGNITLQCTSTNGRPAPNITWSFQNQTFTDTNSFSSYDQTSETYTVVSVLQRPVSAVDNGQTATCRVLHTTLSVPLNSIINVDVKFGPLAGSTTISGNLPTPAIEANQIRLNCTSGSSNPASNITWYNGSDLILNAFGYKRWSGDNNGVITSNILTITLTRYMDGDRIKCRPDNSYGFDSKYVDLDIYYSPLIQPLLNITSTEGETDISLTCLASSKPPASFTWIKGHTLLANGTGTISDNSFSYMIPSVDRAYAGSYQCQANNSVGNGSLENMYLIVKYPPTVNVSTTTSPFYTVSCTAEGNPHSYTYQDWVQIWPQYGSVATIPFTGTTLNLTVATYEMSGVYVCSASNGVAVYGTDLKFMKGNATVLIKAPPVLTDPSPNGTLITVAGRLGTNATTKIKYWSNVAGNVVKCYKHVGDSRSSSSRCFVTETETEVMLPVYNHMVKETGTLALITIQISGQEDMTAYDVVVSNSVQGESVLGLSIVQQGPPEAPTLIGNFSITPGQVILTVLPGFHGGYNQSLVVQISTDLTTWINKTSVHIGMILQTTDINLVSLRENELHHVRVFAYNTEGRSSNFSTVMSFTTAKDSPATPHVAKLIGGTVGAICALLVVVVVLFVLWRNQKVGWIFPQKADKRSLAKDQDNADSVVECAMYVSAGNVQPGTSTPKKRGRLDPFANEYAVVSKTKKDKDIAKISLTEDNKECQKRGKPGNQTYGLREIPKVLETAFDSPNNTASNQPRRPMKNVNDDGLIYADLEFDSSAKYDVIHGLDEVTIYVEIDFTKTAEPLPDSDGQWPETK